MREEKTFGHRLQEAMHDRGVTHEAVAEHVGVSRPAVTHWTAGRREPSTATLRQLAEFLGVDAGWLLFGDAVEPKRRLSPARA